MPPNLKIVRDDSILHVVDKLHPVRMALILLSWAVAVGLVAHEWTDYNHGRAGHHALGLAAGLIAFVFFYSRRDFEFDKSARRLTWRRKWLLWARGGEVPFEDITEVAVEPKKFFIASGRGNTGRLVLRTKQRTIPVGDFYSTRSQTRCEEVAARIREVLRNPRA